MRASRPVLGIVCCTRHVGSDRAQAVMNRYVEASTRYADCAALLAPSLPDLMTAAELAPRLDGLLLTGSPSNVEPARYGQADRADAEGPFDPGRDAMSAGLIDAMLKLGKPVFGICRGLQEINVAFGGSLRRDTGGGDGTGLAHHAPVDASFDAMFEHAHDVAFDPAGRLSAALGADHATVNSVHFQGIDRLGAGLRIEATAPDGLVEAISAEVNGAPVVAVQWHPEWQTAANPRSRLFFELLGRALRGPLPLL